MEAADDMTADMDTNVGPVTKEGLEALVRAFYRDVGSDTALGPIFRNALGTDWSAHLDRIVEFWSTVMLGSRSYRGNVFDKHMALAGVEPRHLARWLSLWQRHSTARFAASDAAELQRVARRIGHKLFRGFFDEPLVLAPDQSAHSG